MDAAFITQGIRLVRRFQSYQAITVAQGHFAGVWSVLEVSYIVAVRRVRVTPG